MFLIAFLLFIATFAVTQIVSEIKGLALDCHRHVDAVKGRGAVKQARGEP